MERISVTHTTTVSTKSTYRMYVFRASMENEENSQRSTAREENGAYTQYSQQAPKQRLYPVAGTVKMARSPVDGSLSGSGADDESGDDGQGRNGSDQ